MDASSIYKFLYPSPPLSPDTRFVGSDITPEGPGYAEAVTLANAFLRVTAETMSCPGASGQSEPAPGSSLACPIDLVNTVDPEQLVDPVPASSIVAADPVVASIPAAQVSPAAGSAGEDDKAEYFVGDMDFVLVFRQGPKFGKASTRREKDCKPIDPPPMVELKLNPQRLYQQGRRFMMKCELVDARPGDNRNELMPGELSGRLVSPMRRIKDTDKTGAALFVFDKLLTRHAGQFRLSFSLYERVAAGSASVLRSRLVSAAFPVYKSRQYPGLDGSTALTRLLRHQGLGLRVRKRPSAARLHSDRDAERAKEWYQNRLVAIPQHILE